MELYNIIGVENIEMTPYYATYNGMVERFNIMLLILLQTLAEDRKSI